MPVPQENLVFVEQASCLFFKIVQDVSGINITLGSGGWSN
jgi:hypothetical protein